MKFTLKKTLSLLLAVVMVVLAAASLGSCNRAGNDPNGDGTKGLEKVRLEHVYITKYLEMNLPENSYVQSVYSAGSNIYLYANRNWQETDEDGNTVYNYSTNLYRMDENGNTVLMDILPKTGNRQLNESSYEYTSVGSVAPAPDGTVWYTYSSYFEDWSDPNNYMYTSSSELVHTSEDGTQLAKISLNGFAESENEYIYINQIIPLPDGRLIAFGNNTLYILKADASLDFKVKLDENSWLSEICASSTGDVFGFLTTYNPTSLESKSLLVRLDMGKREFVEAGSLPSTKYYRLLGAEGNSVVVYDNNAVYSFDTASGVLTEKLNWLNSDLNSNRVSLVVSVSDGRFFITEYDKNYDKMKCAILTKASDSDVIEKYLIKLASVYLNDGLRDAIINYNKSNSEYRIQYLDYSQYNTEKNPSGGTEKLNMDIISGNVPDIISLIELDGNIYSSKGLLLDLIPLMNADQSFDKSLYLENILFSSAKGGKLYSVIPEFSLYSVAGKTEVVGKEPELSVTKLMSLMQQYPDAAAFSLMTRSELLNYFAFSSLGQYIDLEAGTCSFNSPDFINILNLMKKFPEEIDWDAIYADETYWERYDSQYRENRTLLYISYFSYFGEIRNMENQFGGEVTLTGFPSRSGNGSAITPREELAISSKSKVKNACFDFIKYMLSEEYQSEINGSFPIKISCLDKLAEKAMTEDDSVIIFREAIKSSVSSSAGGALTAESGASVISDAIALPDNGTEAEKAAETKETGTETDTGTEKEDKEDISIDKPIIIEPPIYNNKPLTQEQVDKVMHLIRSVTRVSRNYDKIIAIIEEEAPAFYNGQKTAEAVAGIIQSRVQIYISENY